jgi:hypothetical protein
MMLCRDGQKVQPARQEQIWRSPSLRETTYTGRRLDAGALD